MLHSMSDMAERLKAALEGRYAIERELGEGGMATVYLANDLKHQRKVALKVLKPELAAVVGAERFLAEIQVTANLQHPNILPLFDSGEADSFLFYVMPYVEGDTLKDRLAREGQLPVNDAVAIAKDIAEALQAAHEQGVIHRDIKPGNVLISRGKPLISDFGIALALSASGAGERLTETGLSLGTPYYMSPEQATGDQAVGASTDTYALGCVLYEMLVGDPPFAGSTAQAVLGKIIAGQTGIGNRGASFSSGQRGRSDSEGTGEATGGSVHVGSGVHTGSRRSGVSIRGNCSSRRGSCSGSVESADDGHDGAGRPVRPRLRLVVATSTATYANREVPTDLLRESGPIGESRCESRPVT